MSHQNSSTLVRSLDIETQVPTEGTLKGEVPDWLEGVLTRIGPGIFDVGKVSLNHLFDGFSVMHQFSIAKGRVTYKNSALKSETYLTSKEANRLTVHQFGTLAYPDPCKRFLGSLMSRFERPEFTDNCMLNLCYLGDKLYAFTETSMIREVDPTTLDTLGGKTNVSDYVAVLHATSHPHTDPDGTAYTMGNSAGAGGLAYNIIRFPPGENSVSRASIVATFPSRWKMSHAYHHSFGITENYFIFVELPATINMLKAGSMSVTRITYEDLMEWHPQEHSRILLADRKTGKVLDIVYESKAFFCYHHANAFEKDGHVVVDICTYDDPLFIKELSVENLKLNKPYRAPRYTRFVLPLEYTKDAKSKENLVSLEGTSCKAFRLDKNKILCEPEILCDKSVDMPRINYNLNGKEHTYAYTTCVSTKIAESHAVFKINVKTREVKEWSKPGYSPSEPVFVASPGSSAEDDGVLLVSALDRSDDRKVLLVVLNAATFEEEASVEFTAVGKVTKDFHGLFTPASCQS